MSAYVSHQLASQCFTYFMRKASFHPLFPFSRVCIDLVARQPVHNPIPAQPHRPYVHENTPSITDLHYLYPNYLDALLRGDTKEMGPARVLHLGAGNCRISCSAEADCVLEA